MKYIRIGFRSKQKDVHLPLEKWKDIITNPSSQMIAYKLDHEDEWTGRTFNLSDVLFSEPDYDYKPKGRQPIVEIQGNKAVIVGYSGN